MPSKIPQAQKTLIADCLFEGIQTKKAACKHVGEIDPIDLQQKIIKSEK